MCKIKDLKKYGFSLWAAICVLCFAVSAMAQTESARIQGTVTDSTGAAVAGATVTITDLGTSRALKVQTDNDGNYSILSLQPGRYRIEVAQSNFKTTKQDVTIEVAQAATLNFSLEPGAVNETVTITNDAPLVESSSSAIGNVVGSRETVELPLNGRNVLELARLSPGVTQGVVGGFASGAGGDAETYRGRNTGGAAISVNGQRTQANNFLLDGVDNNESLVNTINIFPSAEATQEFRVQTSTAPAEFGRGGGAIINTVIKSGTNKYHGSSYLFIRNSALDARPAFFPATPTQRTPTFRRGQFGATVGGPVVLPHFGEGGPEFSNYKDRIFFFFSYDGLRQFLPTSTDTATVPALAFRNGDFSALPTQLRDPLTGLNICNTPGVATCNGTPYNRLDLRPGNRLNQAALNYLRAFPLPNNGGQLQGNYINTRNEVDQQNVFDARVDATINQSNQLFVRGSLGRYAQTVGTRLATLPSGFGSGSNPTRNKALVVGLNSAFSGSLFNELRLQANTLRFGYEPPFADKSISADLGIANANRGEGLGGGALIGGYNGQLEYTGDYGAYRVPQKTYQIVDSISYTTGKNIFKFGGTILRREVELFRPIAGKGYFRIYGNGDYTQCPGAQGAPSLAQSGTTGFEQADLLIGFACSYQIGTQSGRIITRNYENAAFAQDDWRVSKKLTLNLGLRYEYLTNPAEIAGKQSNFDLTTGRLVVAQAGDSQVKTDKNNFGPRAGFAYDIFGKGKSVIRGGYGLFYFLDRGGISNQLAQNQPFAGSVSYNYNDGYRITFSGQAPLNSRDNRLANAALPLPTVTIDPAYLNNPVGADVIAIRPDNKISNVQQFNVQFQQQLNNSTALSVGYVGTRGRNLILYYNLQGAALSTNTAIPCPVSGRTLGNCYPGISSVNVRDDIGRSQYDSLQVQLERRFSKGWQYIASYTLSKTKDNGEGAFDNTAGGINYVEQYGRSRLDYPNVFSYETIYELPFGRGRKYGSSIPKPLDYVIGGVQINAIFRAQSGNPFDVRVNNRLVDLVGDPYAGQNGRYLNLSAFRAATTTNGFGSLARNALRSPSTNQLNLGLTKNFAITEAAKIQFRAEAFNVFNTLQFGTPNTDLNNTNSVNGFGIITGTSPFSNRQLQFGLRLDF
ncbi:MAG: carboxypeptidase regulatory-like domain-containing protein [Pyrinomonadaceae bacterium]